MRPSHVPTLLLFGLIALAGCRKGPTTPLPVAHARGTPTTDDALNAWRNAGLGPEGFAAVQPTPVAATYCVHGLVHGVDTTVCEYDSDQALERGVAQVKADWERKDVHTGVVLRAKRTTMVAADRERREPSGKTISAMAKLFGKL